MMLNADMSLPRYLEVAHWLYEQKRFLSARETAALFGGTPWSMGWVFSKIKSKPSIFIVDERQVRISGGKQDLIRVKYIYPYLLDEQNQLHRRYSDGDNVGSPLTWHDLVCRQWVDLLHVRQEHP